MNVRMQNNFIEEKVTDGHVYAAWAEYDSLIRRMVAADNSGQADCFKFGKPSGESEPMINCNSLCDFGGTLREAGNHARITLNEAGKECTLPGGEQIDMLDINCKYFGIGPPDQCGNAPLKF